MHSTGETVPIIRITELQSADPKQGTDVVQAIRSACRDFGFFYVVDHGVPLALQQELEVLSRRFFALPEAIKSEIAMAKAGLAWRGFFPLGGELTSGAPDLKEGIYFGEELPSDHPLVRAQTPLHGANLFPQSLPRFKQLVLDYIAAMTELGHRLMEGIALSLGLERGYFLEHFTKDPFVLFRIFHYPAARDEQERAHWGVGEHTDYGLLTILKQDEIGGLEIEVGGRWISAPPIPNSFVCNLGDWLEMASGGLYRSTPHRVRNLSSRSRLSFPFFFDPNFFAKSRPLPLKPTAASSAASTSAARWDGADLHAFRGSYGDYIQSKVAKVFPGLKASLPHKF